MTSGKPANAASSYEASMIELTAMNNPIEVIDEAVILPELIVALVGIMDLHGVQKLHYPAGCDPAIGNRRVSPRRNL